MNAFDLGDEAIDEAEVAARDPDDGRDGGRMADPAVGRRARGGESLGEDGRQFVRSELSVFVGEADAAVELRVASKTFLDARPMRTTPMLCRSK